MVTTAIGERQDSVGTLVKGTGSEGTSGILFTGLIQDIEWYVSKNIVVINIWVMTGKKGTSVSKQSNHLSRH